VYWSFVKDAYARLCTTLQRLNSLNSGAAGGGGASGFSHPSGSGVAELRANATAAAARGSGLAAGAGGSGSGLPGADVAAAALLGATEADSDSASCRAGGGDSGGGAAGANAAPGWVVSRRNARLLKKEALLCPVDALLPVASAGGAAFAFEEKLNFDKMTSSKQTEAEALSQKLSRFEAPAALLLPSAGASDKKRTAFANLVANLGEIRRALLVFDAASGSRCAYLLPPCAFAREQMARLGASEPPTGPWLCALVCRPDANADQPAAPQQAAAPLPLPAAWSLAPAAPPALQQQPQPPPKSSWVAPAVPPPPVGFSSDDEDDAPAETEEQRRLQRVLPVMKAPVAAPPLPPPPPPLQLPPPPPQLPPPPPRPDGGAYSADVASLRAKSAAFVAELDAAFARNPLSSGLAECTVLLHLPLPAALASWSGGSAAASAAAFFNSVVGGVVSAALDERDARVVRVCFGRRSLATAALRLRGELCGGQPLNLARPPLHEPHLLPPPPPQQQQQVSHKRARSPPRWAEQYPPKRGPWR